MIVNWSFNNFNVISIADGLYLISNKAFCSIRTNRAKISVIFKIRIQKIWYIMTVGFFINTCGREFREWIYRSYEIYFIHLFLKNLSSKIKIRLIKWYLKLKLLSGKNRFKILTDCRACLTFSWYNNILAVDLLPPAVRGLAYHSPGTWLACVNFID